MSDSLRDQLIAAGYKAPAQDKKKQANQNKKKKKKPAKKKNHPASTGKAQNRKKNANADDEAAVAERKKQKALIKALIEDAKLTDWTGEVAYRYLVDSRIRELYVKEEVQQKLAARTLAITRLNGDTYIVPRETALAIGKINPQWSVFNLDEQSADNPSDESDEYSEYKVPDDLKW